MRQSHGHDVNGGVSLYVIPQALAGTRAHCHARCIMLPLLSHYANTTTTAINLLYLHFKYAGLSMYVCLLGPND